MVSTIVRSMDINISHGSAINVAERPLIIAAVRLIYVNNIMISEVLLKTVVGPIAHLVYLILQLTMTPNTAYILLDVAFAKVQSLRFLSKPDNWK